MLEFKCDYSEGAHINILQKLIETNLEQTEGYGLDEYSASAILKIKEKLKDEKVDIHFVSGGTQANTICLSSFLKPYEAAISVSTGHINTHEAGAIESTGHKVINVQGENGKMRVKDLEQVLVDHYDEHLVKPKLVYISNSTELGTIYTKKELLELKSFIDENNMLFYMDGARIGSAITSEVNDVLFEDLTDIFDAFYIGGTKNGALFGEAIVICNEEYKKDFRYMIKQKGALFAKGRILGIQFEELFKEELYFKIAKNANDMAMKIKKELLSLEYKTYRDSFTNQQFFIIENSVLQDIEKEVALMYWGKYSEEESIVRIVTSWATTEEMTEKLISTFKKYKRDKA